MLPIILNSTEMTVGLAGEGDALERRRAMLEEAGVHPICVALDVQDGLERLALLYIAGAARTPSAALAQRAKAQGVLVNVEDVPELCDFHVPATVRRGELLLTVSSAGRSPGLVRIVREWLADRFGVEWSSRVGDMGKQRDGWRAEGLLPGDIANRTRALVAERKWLA